MVWSLRSPGGSGSLKVERLRTQFTHALRSQQRPSVYITNHVQDSNKENKYSNQSATWSNAMPWSKFNPRAYIIEANARKHRITSDSVENKYKFIITKPSRPLNQPLNPYNNIQISNPIEQKRPTSINIRPSQVKTPNQHSIHQIIISHHSPPTHSPQSLFVYGTPETQDPAHHTAQHFSTSSSPPQCQQAPS